MCESSLSCKWLIDKELVCWCSPLSFYLYTCEMKKCILDCCSGGGGGGVSRCFPLEFYGLIQVDTKWYRKTRQKREWANFTMVSPSQSDVQTTSRKFQKLLFVHSCFLFVAFEKYFFFPTIVIFDPKISKPWHSMIFFVFFCFFDLLRKAVRDFVVFVDEWSKIFCMAGRESCMCSSKWLKTPCRCWWIKDLSSLWMAGSTFQSWYSHRTICVIPCCLSSWFLSWTDNGSFDLISNGWVLKRKTKNWFVFVFVCWLAYLVDWIPHVFWLFS